MATKILIAMDESENSFRAVELVGNSIKPEADVTLFSVLLNTETMCALQSPELTPYFVAEQTSFCVLEDKKKELVGQTLEKARQTLVQQGFDEKRIQTRMVTSKKGVARDIVSEVKGGDYDMVVLGRRGLSGIMEFIMGSVSQKVLHGVDKVSVLLAN